MTTADNWNRKRDKEALERELQLKEEGDPNICIMSPKGTLLAKGYTRIVYGDHGPYIELEAKHIVREAWVKGRDKSSFSFYKECVPKDGSNVLLYVQIRDVKNLRNPPRGPLSVNNNRSDGYADYKVGMLYINPREVTYEFHL